MISKEKAVKLQEKLTYGRGIFQSEWPGLIEYRSELLKNQGENPDDFNLGSRYVTRKFK